MTEYTLLLENISTAGTYNLNGKLSDYKYVYVLSGYSGGENIGQLIPVFIAKENERFINNHSAANTYMRRVFYNFPADNQIAIAFDTTQFYIKKVYGVN